MTWLHLARPRAVTGERDPDNPTSLDRTLTLLLLRHGDCDAVGADVSVRPGGGPAGRDASERSVMRHLHVKTTAVGFHHGVSSRIPLIATSTVKAAVNCCTESLRLRDAPMRPPSSMIGVKAIPVRRMVVVSTPTCQ